jgi:hypothetical protein
MPGIKPYTAADLERLKSLQVRPQGWTHATKDQTREYRDPAGHMVKVVTDQLGNRTRLRRDGQDVRIVAIPHVQVRVSRSTGRVVA